MESVLIVIHLLIVAALVMVVLLQRSEGGGLGIGGGGGGGAGGFMTGRAAANVLTRATAFLAVAFFATSIALTIVNRGGESGSILDGIPQEGQTVPQSGDIGAGGGGILDDLQPQGEAVPQGPQVPQSQ